MAYPMSQKNPRIMAKDRNLIKGAIRRVFSRSELRKRALQRSIIEYLDPSRPRVKKWSVCPDCKQYTPTYKMQVDHINPIVPINLTLEDMSWDTVIDNIWCEEKHLQPLCKPCHSIKTKAENKLRRNYRKGLKNEKEDH